VIPAFQTAKERKFCRLNMTQSQHEPALLRTFYSTQGQETYSTLARSAVLQNLVEEDGVWDDSTLYDFGSDWQRILLRVPELCDEERHDLTELYSENEQSEQLGSDYEDTETYLWSCRVATRLYVADRDALESNQLVVYYLDVHGKALWHHRFDAGVFLEFDGAWQSMSLAEINNCFSESRERGSLLHL
jgi:hypothetical protein